MISNTNKSYIEMTQAKTEYAVLTHNLLKKIFSNGLAMLRIPYFVAIETAQRLHHWLVNHKEVSKYTHEVRKNGKTFHEYFGVDRLGFPYNLTYDGNHALKHLYYQLADQFHTELRQVCDSPLSPIDKLFLELNKCWKEGAKIANFDGNKMSAGIGRIMRPEYSMLSEIKPHIDVLPSSYARLDGQYSVIIYLGVPKLGGELEVWDMEPLRINESIEDKTSICDRKSLPTSTVLKPNIGDLVIINTRRFHAVRAFSEGLRSSIQVFIGYNKREPLILWS